MIFPPRIQLIRDRAFIDNSLVAIDELAEGWAAAETKLEQLKAERPNPSDVIQLKGELLARYQAMKHNLQIEITRILIDRLDSYINSI